MRHWNSSKCKQTLDTNRRKNSPEKGAEVSVHWAEVVEGDEVKAEARAGSVRPVAEEEQESAIAIAKFLHRNKFSVSLSPSLPLFCGYRKVDIITVFCYSDPKTKILDARYLKGCKNLVVI